MTKPLKSGDRVAFYEYDQRKLAVVTSINPFMIRIDGYGGPSFAHPKQCRRLRPKPKPAPDAGKLREVWLWEADVATVQHNSPLSEKCEVTARKVSRNDIRFVECPPGHAVVSREGLAKAWVRLSKALAYRLSR